MGFVVETAVYRSVWRQASIHLNRSPALESIPVECQKFIILLTVDPAMHNTHILS